MATQIIIRNSMLIKTSFSIHRKAADLDGSEQINSVSLSGLKDSSGQVKGSIVDISGNPVGTLNSSGEVEFSEEDIEKFLTANSTHPLYFKPQQDFTGNVELTIHATSKDGEVLSQVSSSQLLLK